MKPIAVGGHKSKMQIRALFLLAGLAALPEVNGAGVYLPGNEQQIAAFPDASLPALIGSGQPTSEASAAHDALVSSFYPSTLAQNAVAALRPELLNSYANRSEAEKIAFLRENFPLMFRWDLNPENRRTIIAAASPDHLAEYDGLASEDLRIQFCFKYFGPSGVVMPLAPSIRQQTVALLYKESGMEKSVEYQLQNYEKGIEAYKKVIKKTHAPETDLPDKETITFLYALTNELQKYQGQRVYDPAEIRARAMVPFMAAQVPFLGGALAGAALERMMEANRSRGTNRFRNQTALTIITEMARASHMNDAQVGGLIDQFNQGLPIDQARLLLPQAMTAIQIAAGPSPVLQSLALSQPGRDILSIIDPQKAAHWDQMTFGQKCLELRNMQALIMWGAADMLSENEEVAVTAYQRWDPFITGSAHQDSAAVLAKRFFGADLTQADPAHDPTARAAAVFQAVFFVMFENFFPFTE
ncbi:MAG: hypothetical protein JO145_09100 [Acidobacteriaceae bacterium]|nr:hypothetical protein [Acidobacteriaceae bacterium]